MENQASLFKEKSYVFLISAQLFSALGEGIALLALLALFGLENDASPLELAMIVLALGVPTIVFGPIVGVFADKMERRTLMISSDLIRAILMISIVFTTELWQIYVILVLKGTFESIFTPAKNGKLRELVDDHHMDQAVGISTIIDYGMRILGPAAGGVLVAFFGTNLAFYINGGGFLISALLLLGVPRNQGKLNETVESESIPFIQRFTEGLAFIKNVRFLMYGTLVFSIAMFVLTLADAQLVTLFREIPGGSTALFGTIMAATGLGTLVVAGVLSQYKKGSATKLMAIGTLGVGLAFFGCAYFTKIELSHVWYWFPLLALSGGGFAGAVFVPFQANAQKQVPENLTSRVFGVINSLSTLATVAGPLIGGIIATMYGIIPLFLISCGFLVVVGIFTLIFSTTIEGSNSIVSSSGESTSGTSNP